MYILVSSTKIGEVDFYRKDKCNKESNIFPVLEATSLRIIVWLLFKPLVVGRVFFLQEFNQKHF